MAEVAEVAKNDSPLQARAPQSGSRSDDDRWIGSSLARAMRRAQLPGLVLVQLILLLAALESSLAVPTLSAFLVAGGVTVTGLVVLLLRVNAMALILAHYLALGFYHVVVAHPHEPLIGALIPLTAWTVMLPITLRTGAWPIVASGLLTAMCAALIVFAHPDWEPSVAGASVVTNAMLIVAAVVFMRFLRGIAGSLDRQKRAAVDEELHAARQRASKETTAEYVRVLHDTIVNTFGALARGGTRGTHLFDARQRCRRDLERIRAFQRSTAVGRRHGLSLTELEHVGLPVSWEGMSGDDLRRFQALLPVSVLDALYGCASEAILNATKHSGAARVIVDVRYVDDELRMEISDDGRGFAQDDVVVRGIAESIVARGEARGIGVALDSEIGEGTTVRLSYPLVAPAEIDAAHGPVNAIRPLRDFTRAAASCWSVLAIVVGVALDVINPLRDSLPSSLILAILLVLGGLAWTVCRRDRRAPGWLIGLMLVAIPVVNWCALASVDDGEDAPYLFQAASLTVIPILLHVFSRTLHPFRVAIGVQLVSMLIIGLGGIGSGAQRFAEIILLEAPVLGLLVIWSVFLRMFRAIGVESADSQRAWERARRDAASSQAAADVQMQWSASGLHDPLRLLQDIADGVVSPNDPETRRRCRDEEAFLRQISALPREATLMSPWFALALADARRRRVRLELQVENARLDDVRSADAFGRLMLDCIIASPQQSTLNVTLLHRGDSTRMLIVGSGEGGLADVVRERSRTRLRIVIEELPDRVLIDATTA